MVDELIALWHYHQDVTRPGSVPPGLPRGEVALDHRPPRRGPRLQRVPLQGSPCRRWPGRGCNRLRRADHYGAPGGHRRRRAEAMNRICLIGLVGCWPRPVGPAGDLGFVLLTERDPLGQRVDRHRVILGGIHLPDISDFAPGATVYVEGHLARQGESRRVSVIAGCAWSILPAPPPPVAGEPTSSHASPRAHQRSVHPGRGPIGTPRERLIWVRPPTVRPRSVAALKP